MVINSSRSSPCLSWVSFNQESCLSLVFPKASLKSCLKAVQWASSVSAVPAVKVQYLKVRLALKSVSKRGRVVLEGKELDLEVDK